MARGTCGFSEALRSKALASAWLIIAIAVMPRLDATELPPLSLDQLFATPKLTGVEPSSPVWSPDSRYFAFTWNDEGLPQRDLWIASRDGDKLRRLGSPPTAAGSVRDFAWLPDGQAILSLRGNGLWSTTLETGQQTLLATVGDGASNLSVSPDASKAAYLKDGDLWWVDLVDGTVIAATEVGIPGLSSVPVGRTRSARVFLQAQASRLSSRAAPRAQTSRLFGGHDHLNRVAVIEL